MKKKYGLICILLFLAHLTACKGQITALNSIMVIELQELDQKKAALLRNESTAVESYKALIATSDSILEYDAFSVVNKLGMPPSGDKHDYMTIGPYWWPNPETSDGLPYIRRDGEINPETRNNFTDYVELESFVNALKVLTEAFYITKNAAYATKAKVLISAWFLDDATKMNPNINFGQSIPGNSDGRKFGIIEFGRIITVLKCLELLKHRKQLDAEIEQGMAAWLSEYTYWLENSQKGKDAANAKNNHGTHYDAQLLSILIYLGRIEKVRKHLATVTVPRIFSQIEPDGSQPRELARTKSFSYSVMNLHGLLYLARMGQKVGVDLWRVESKDGRSIKKAFEYIVPYLTNEKSWKHSQITNYEKDIKKFISDMVYVKKIFNESSFDKALIQLQNKNTQLVFEKNSL